MAKLARLMPPDLPLMIDPAKFALSGKALAGKVALKEMSRLLELARINDEKAVYNLAFTRDDKGIFQIKGDIATTLIMLCQRCLNEMTLTMHIPVSVGIVRNQDEIDMLADDLEPYLAEDSKISLLKLIEEEILLSLPISPLHSENACPATAILQGLKPKPVSPFAVLKTMKENKTRSD